MNTFECRKVTKFSKKYRKWTSPLGDTYLHCNCHQTLYPGGQHFFHSVSRDLGVPLPENKTEGPTTHLTYLSLNIDTVEMKVNMSTAILDQLCIGIRFIIRLRFICNSNVIKRLFSFQWSNKIIKLSSKCPSWRNCPSTDNYNAFDRFQVTQLNFHVRIARVTPS
jgi:hypothetical protein